MKLVIPAMIAASALQLAVLVPAFAAADKVSPDDIKKIFGTGKPFTAQAPSGSTLTLTLSPDGSAKAASKGKKKGETGTWRVSDSGYCSTWGKGSEKCYTIQKNGDKYDVVNAHGAVVAHWKARGALPRLERWGVFRGSAAAAAAQLAMRTSEMAESPHSAHLTSSSPPHCDEQLAA